MSKKKVDGRRENGGIDMGLGEDAQLVRGPAELMGRAREAAKKMGLPVSEWWRRAAALMLEKS